MKRLSALVVARPWLFIAFFAMVTLGFGTQLTRLEIDPEIKSQLPPDMPARVSMRQVEEQFGGGELLMVVLEAPDVTAPEVLRQLEAISRGLEAIEGFDRVLGLFTLQDIRGSADGMMAVERAVDAIPADPDDQASLKRRLSENPLVYGNVIAKDFSAAATIVLVSGKTNDAAAIAAVDALIARTPGPGAVSVGGMPWVRTHVSRDIRSDMVRFMPVGLSIILGFLYACFRQLRGVVLPFLVVVMSVVVSMGLIPLFGWKVQMVTVILPVILLAVANDYGIHLMARYQEENVPGAVRESTHLAAVVLEDLGVPVLAAGVTTIAGLLCLTSHIIVPARQLGILGAIGIAFALCCSLLFVPALLAVLPVPAPLASLSGEARTGVLERALGRVASGVVAWPGQILGVLLTASLVAASGVAMLKVDTNPVNYYASDAPVAVTSRKINRLFGGSTELSVMVEGDIQDPAVLEKIDTLEAHLRGLPQVGYTSSVAQVVRRMNQAVMGGGAAEDKLPGSREAVAQYFLLYGMGGDPADFERLVDFDYAHTVVTARINSLSTQEISDVVEAARAWTASDLAGLGTTLGGFGLVFSELVAAVVGGQLWSLGTSLGMVFLLVAASFRSLAAGFYATLPLLVAMPVLFGLMGFLGIELNIITAMLSSIMVGVGVDYTIHFLWRYRVLRLEGLAPPEAVHRTLITSGRGIVFNALSVIAGFAVLLISNFLPVQFFGFLVVVSIGACLVGALVIMPALVLVARPRFLEPSPSAVAAAAK